MDFNATLEKRRKSVEESIRQIDTADMKKIGEDLFPYLDHPWRDAFFNFVDENPHSTFYHARTTDGFEILYCKEKEKGIWFVPDSGKGPLQARGIQIMKEIVG